MLIATCSLGKAQSIQLGLQCGYNSTHFNVKGTSYTDMRNERLWSFGHNTGASISLLHSKGYYQRMQYGAKIEWNRTYHEQIISVYPMPYNFQEKKFWKGRYSAVFNDFAFLYTHNPVHHQGVYLEIGPTISFVSQHFNGVFRNTLPYEVTLTQTEYKPLILGVMMRCGLFYNLNKSLAWNFSAQGGKNLSSLTISKEYGRLWGGFSFGIVYKLKT